MDRIKHKFFLFNDELRESEQFNQEIINHGTTIYELLKVKDCTPVFLEKYLQRVNNSLRLIGRQGWISNETIVAKMSLIIHANCVTDEDHLKVLISFDNDFFAPPQDFITLFFTTVPLPSKLEYNTGVRTVSLNATRYLPNAKIYQPSLRKLTEQMIESQDIYEVILLNEQGYITEGSRSNIFFIDKDNNLITPHLDDVLPGITRSNVIELAKRNDVNFLERKIHYRELPRFDAAFVTGTSRKILPLQSIDDHRFNPQNRLLRNLIDWYENMIQDYVKSHKKNFQDICQC